MYSNKVPTVDFSKNAEIYKEQMQDIANSIRNTDSGTIKAKKILCEVWLLGKDGHRDKILGSKFVKAGKKEFQLNIGGVPMRFKINYDELKEHKKFLLYQVDLMNTVGAIRYYPYEKEKAYPNQVAIMLADFAVRTFHKKGGMPFWYLLIPVLGMMALGIALATIAPDYANSKDIAQQAVNLYNQEHALRLNLEQQLANTVINP